MLFRLIIFGVIIKIICYADFLSERNDESCDFGVCSIVKYKLFGRSEISLRLEKVPISNCPSSSCKNCLKKDDWKLVIKSEKYVLQREVMSCSEAKYEVTIKEFFTGAFIESNYCPELIFC